MQRPDHRDRRRSGGADLSQIGSIDLTDLDIISRFYGRDFLPYPLMLTRPSRFPTHGDYVAYARSVPDRFNHGDLRIFRRWAASYAYAEIRVECHVQFIPASTPSIRVIANRIADLGYLAKQRPDEDVIDVYQVSPYDLGLAIVESVQLDKPGEHPEIVIPEYVPAAGDGDAAADFTIRDSTDAAAPATVRRADVTALGTIQSHWRPTRRWGLDPGKNAVVWVRIKDDGDYLYTTDFSRARPIRPPLLVERIDALIAEDVKALQDFRSS